MINLIRDIIEDKSNYDEKIPLDSICSDTLKHIFNFCEQCGYRNENFVKKPILTPSFDQIFTQLWEKDFFDKLSMT
jgi:hypothetical protein